MALYDRVQRRRDIYWYCGGRGSPLPDACERQRREIYEDESAGPYSCEEGIFGQAQRGSGGICHETAYAAGKMAMGIRPFREPTASGRSDVILSGFYSPKAVAALHAVIAVAGVSYAKTGVDHIIRCIVPLPETPGLPTFRTNRACR